MTGKQYPEFFIVGAQKAGTTTLHSWLTKHPLICLPKIKETHFFSNPSIYALGIEWYLKQFQKCSKGCILGEVDPEYMLFPEVSKRLSHHISAPKVIFVFREPLSRAYSNYLMAIRFGFENLSFDKALIAEKVRKEECNIANIPFNIYMERGRYADQVKIFHENLPISKFLYIRFDDIFNKEKKRKTLSKICSFIGLDDDPQLLDMSTKLNRASVPRYRFIRDIIFKDMRWKSAIGRLIPHDIKLRLAMFLEKSNRMPIDQTMDDWASSVPRMFVMEALSETEKLELLTGLDLSDWKAMHIALLENTATI